MYDCINMGASLTGQYWGVGHRICGIDPLHGREANNTWVAHIHVYTRSVHSGLYEYLHGNWALPHLCESFKQSLLISVQGTHVWPTYMFVKGESEALVPILNMETSCKQSIETGGKAAIKRHWLSIFMYHCKSCSSCLKTSWIITCIAIKKQHFKLHMLLFE